MIVFCSIYWANIFWFNIQFTKKSCRLQFFIFMQNVSFCISTFVEFGRLNQVSPKLVYRPQISSRSASGDKINKPFIHSLQQSLSKTLITEVHRAQQTMWQEFIQTDREGRTYFSIHWWSISHYKRRPSFSSKRYSLFSWHRTLKSSQVGE